MDREERPLGVCGRAGSRRFSANNSIVAALYGGAVYRKVERCHLETGIAGVVMGEEWEVVNVESDWRGVASQELRWLATLVSMQLRGD